ncbi:hypothetical protein SAMN05421855_102699 [Ulvibacter litoralis]|uniref:Lipoprotein n=2 Tax=Ulvibacter litoralis TaxID=227084 RepID=A0A1G7FQ78_9FLAO|nr:hypothetical protein GCM10008083_12120 [Ulvibacter litoralis]SDE78018.1 hypothetical protein SAMN05421855_102699 [Ulvibacter litoralis]
MVLNKNKMLSTFQKFVPFIAVLALLTTSCKNNNTNDLAEEQAVATNETTTNFKALLKSLPEYSEAFSEGKIEGFVVSDDEGTYLNKNLIETNPHAVSVFNDTKTGHNADNWMYKMSNKEYFPAYKLTKGNTILIGSFVEYSGENNTPGIFFQLNTFSTNGTQKDYLIVFNRFNDQMVFKSEFEATADFSEVKVTSVEEEWLSFDEHGNITGEFAQPNVTNFSKTFNLTASGTFSEK